MSAADAFTRATISALSASVRLTGPLADLMYRVLPSTLSIVPATRWRDYRQATPDPAPGSSQSRPISRSTNACRSDNRTATIGELRQCIQFGHVACDDSSPCRAPETRSPGAEPSGKKRGGALWAERSHTGQVCLRAMGRAIQGGNDARIEVERRITCAPLRCTIGRRYRRLPDGGDACR